jgi:replicative DNA helicase
VAKKEYLVELQRRKKKLVDRIEKMKISMNETKELDTLARLSNLFEEAKKELEEVNRKLDRTGIQED